MLRKLMRQLFGGAQPGPSEESEPLAEPQAEVAASQDPEQLVWQMLEKLVRNPATTWHHLESRMLDVKLRCDQGAVEIGYDANDYERSIKWVTAKVDGRDVRRPTESAKDGAYQSFERALRERHFKLLDAQRAEDAAKSLRVLAEMAERVAEKHDAPAQSAPGPQRRYTGPNGGTGMMPGC